MDLIAGILVASLVSEEALRFGAVFEQRSEASCGLAAAASLLSLYCGIPASEDALAARLDSLGPRSGEGATLGGILILLADAGIKAKAFRMDASSLSSALGAGYLPLILRYDKPDPHFVLLIGAGPSVFVLADPARGLEALEEAELLRRWDGSTLLVDRRST
ncbi:MAG: cysteine peptidase family C39 domain-containing protein, partial [Spirochaetaceae bacterium]|nr:cysteine peptidase family C39 domain-containing protein [Spirochaetaceae bacterium]